MTRRKKACFWPTSALSRAALTAWWPSATACLASSAFLRRASPRCAPGPSRRGRAPPQAAGKIHSDIERGFIRAEVISFEELMACGSLAAAREKGLVRSEGKDYVMQDGDVVLFRFNV